MACQRRCLPCGSRRRRLVFPVTFKPTATHRWPPRSLPGAPAPTVARGREGAEGSPLPASPLGQPGWRRPAEERGSSPVRGRGSGIGSGCWLVLGLCLILSGGESKLRARETAFARVNAFRRGETSRECLPPEAEGKAGGRGRGIPFIPGNTGNAWTEGHWLPYHTAPQKPLCPLCEERLCAKIKKNRRKY